MSVLAATGTPDAATQSHWLAWLVTVAAVALVLVVAGYLAKCWLFPFTACQHLDTRHAWRCRHCQGTGLRLRTGRRLINHFRSLRRH